MAASRLSHTKWAWSGTVLWEDKQPLGPNRFMSYSERRGQRGEFTHKSVLLSTVCRTLGNGKLDSGWEIQHCFPQMIMFIFPEEDGGKWNKSDGRREECKVRVARGASILMWLKQPSKTTRASLPGLDTLVTVLRKYLNSDLKETHFNSLMQKFDHWKTKACSLLKMVVCKQRCRAAVFLGFKYNYYNNNAKDIW